MTPDTSQSQAKKDDLVSSNPAEESIKIDNEKVDTKSLPSEAKEGDEENAQQNTVAPGTEDVMESVSPTTEPVENDVEDKETAGL